MKLFHFSEQADIQVFYPRIVQHPREKPRVWAIDEDHMYHYYFPRDCPRIVFWNSPFTSKSDQIQFFAQTKAKKVIAVENNWYQHIMRAVLYRYQFPSEDFHCIDQNAGYFVAEKAIVPLAVEPIDDLVNRVISAQIELRITPSLWEMHDELINSTVCFSMIRMRNVMRRG
ncbi:hypothetical protein SAMN05444392_11049 [Seinonella peptonophila]|uniref:Uncharacterized protein n=1 Tax=Seinonella peptonophila TaxID=112248 RepID=A0A1M4ZQ34_9BACL|nr:DUF6886 family protein [Seinonella peptonophila]SHF20114.1 hypothetical protein SAMN05444392_11049 [Seinonella peptonophila]